MILTQMCNKKKMKFSRPAELASYQASWFPYPFGQWASIQTSWDHTKRTKSDAQKLQEHFPPQRNGYTKPTHIQTGVQRSQTTNWTAWNISIPKCHQGFPQNANVLLLVYCADSYKTPRILPYFWNSFIPKDQTLIRKKFQSFRKNTPKTGLIHPKETTFGLLIKG